MSDFLIKLFAGQSPLKRFTVRVEHRVRAQVVRISLTKWVKVIIDRVQKMKTKHWILNPGLTKTRKNHTQFI